MFELVLILSDPLRHAYIDTGHSKSSIRHFCIIAPFLQLNTLFEMASFLFMKGITQLEQTCLRQHSDQPKTALSN